MKKNVILSLLSFLLTSMALGQELPKKFSALLSAHGLKFSMPENFSPVSLKDTTVQNYQYALKSKDGKLEWRVYITEVKDFFSFAVKSEEIVDEIQLVKGDEIESEALDSIMLKNYNAKEGYGFQIYTNKKFGGDYGLCSVTALFHNNKCFFTFVLFKEEDAGDLAKYKEKYLLPLINSTIKFR
jgi:hypothetical protein